jgi:hypothetical protein
MIAISVAGPSDTPIAPMRRPECISFGQFQGAVESDRKNTGLCILGANVLSWDIVQALRDGQRQNLI